MATAPSPEARPSVGIRQILCPIDLSDFSPAVLAHATALARWFDAKVVPLHVFGEWMPAGRLATHGAWVELLQDARTSDMAQLSALLGRFASSEVIGQLRTAEGDPAAEIIRVAAETGTDLIVMGTHGRSGFDRFALGSVTEKVLRKAACPVLTLPEAAARHPHAAYRHILCATDFSPASEAALRFAAGLASKAGAQMTALHVLEGGVAAGIALDGPFTVSEFEQWQDDTARERLRLLAATCASGGLRIEAQIARGKPHHEILRVAGERSADLIVVGVHGHNVVDLALFGSTTNQVVRRAACPVLTLRT